MDARNPSNSARSRSEDYVGLRSLPPADAEEPTAAVASREHELSSIEEQRLGGTANESSGVAPQGLRTHAGAPDTEPHTSGFAAEPTTERELVDPTKSGREDITDPLLGRSIAGKYRISAQIAKGGMGRIYRAEQAPLGRLVAIKVVNAKFAADDPEYEKRFFLEASVVSQLTHPNTVTVFDYGKTEDEIYFMAMELLTGRTLHRALKTEGPIEALRALKIVRQVCRSVREAHDFGVVHRDLKPANVFLAEHPDEEDFVKVLDFGLAKHVGENVDEQLTQTGLFMGSPKYMAPEQVDGQKLDGRADIYSTGILFFEILTGRVPFEKPTSVTTLMAHVTDPVPPMMEVAPAGTQIPAVVEAIVRRCLEKKPEDRFATMDALLVALKEAEEILLRGGTGTSPLPRVPSAPPAAAPDARSAQATFDVLLPRSSAPSPFPRPEKKRGFAPYLLVAATAALVVAGLFGARYVRGLGPSERDGQGLRADAVVTAAPVVASAAPSSAPQASEAVATVDVLLTSTPVGAEIRDEAGVLCEKTPCTIKLVPEELTLARSMSAFKPGFLRDNRRTTLKNGYQVTLLSAPRTAASTPVVEGFKGAY